MTPRITGFSDLRGRFDAMPFDGAIAVRLESPGFEEMMFHRIVWGDGTISQYEPAVKHVIYESWFMLKDMQGAL